MRHTDDEIVGTIFDGGVHGDFKSGNEALATLKSKSFHRVKLLSQEASEIVRPVESVVQVNLISVIHFFVLDTLKFEADPIADVTLWNVHELHTNLAAVSLMVCLNDILELPNFPLLENSRLVMQLN